MVEACAAHHLDTLPDDVLGSIFRELSVDELVKCRSVNKSLRQRVDHLGVPLHLISNRISHLTLSPQSPQWPPYLLAKHNHLINRSLSSHLWHALQVGRTWSQKVIPTVYLDAEKERLILGVGDSVVVHPLSPPRGKHGEAVYGASVAQRGREFPIRTPGSGSMSDIVSIIDLHDPQGSLIVAQFDGQIQRMVIPNSGANTPRVTARYAHPSSSKTRLRGVTGSENGDLIMSTSWDGAITLLHTRSPWIHPTSINLEGKVAWSSLLTTSHPTLAPTAILGTKTSMVFHPILPTGISLNHSRSLKGPELPQTSSPYDICLPPPSSSHHPALLLSAWYDSHLRLHDLRSPSPSPIMEFQDPYVRADSSAFYSACFTGGHYIAGGGAMHGTVAFFDVRNDKTGWSCFSPGGKGSPVYELQGEGGRVWGVTERRAFVLAFDGSGDEAGGLVAREARAVPQFDRDRGRYAPSGWRGRGGKWNWTVRYDADEGHKAVGYEHTDRSISLFDSLVAA